jgi:hypothetical protein
VPFITSLVPKHLGAEHEKHSPVELLLFPVGAIRLLQNFRCLQIKSKTNAVKSEEEVMVELV